jgi:hypothetical protein
VVSVASDGLPKYQRKALTDDEATTAPGARDAFVPNRQGRCPRLTSALGLKSSGSPDPG